MHKENINTKESDRMIGDRLFLNTLKPVEVYTRLFKSKFFVDKSMIIDKLNEVIGTSNNYICITKPRRFGKSSIADMLVSYYTKASDSKSIFDTLDISSTDSYLIYLNKYNVISISFNEIPDGELTYSKYINNIIDKLKREIITTFSMGSINQDYSLRRVLELSGNEFIFIFDEWDYIFSNNLFEENQNDFLEFLRNILKDQSHVALAYMTGLLPIKKYSSISAMNMFDEYTVINDMIFGEYFGFTEKEVEELCSKQDIISMNDLSDWYNGYLTETEIRLYNPRSVTKALYNGRCKSYWTNTGAMEEVLHYSKYNILEMREDVISMVSGEEMDLIIGEEFRAGQKELKTKEEIYSAMIAMGFLSYNYGYIRIPNKEVLQEFIEVVK